MVELSFLSEERSLPDASGRGNVVHWRVFRRREEAETFAPAIQIAQDQALVGGYSRDSVGPLWWVGVKVANVTRWGNRGAINKRAG